MTDHPALVPATAAELGLAPYYDQARLYRSTETLSTDVEMPRRHAQLESELGHRPTVVFTPNGDATRDDRSVLGNPYPRSVLLAAMDAPALDWCAELTSRLRGSTPGWASVSRPDLGSLPGLDAPPVVRHRPGDVGPYVTAGIGVTVGPDGSGVNLGFYRIQVISATEGRIFLDPRTDGHRNLQAWLGKGRSMPISVFLGANPAFSLVAASRLPASGDDYEVAARLLGSEVRVWGDPPVPVDATHVISGWVTEELAPEGPFGEFKGYYVDARRSHVLRVNGLHVVEGAPWPTIVPGAESGLTLMSMQNELLMFEHLTRLGFRVRSVRYPLEARGEFLTLIETDTPGDDLIEAAMEFDVRSKFMVCGARLDDLWQSVATYGFTTRTSDFVRKGRVEGERLGLALKIPPVGRPVEY